MTRTADIFIDVLVERDDWTVLLPDYDDICQHTAQIVLSHSDIFKTIGNAPCEISVTLTDDKNIRTLNADYRNKDKPTNVLSFPQINWDDDDWRGEPFLLLGDVVVALETLQRESTEQDKDFKDHFIHMLVHSLVHLFGYDHEHDDEAAVMEALEIEILNTIGIKNPYNNV